MEFKCKKIEGFPDYFVTTNGTIYSNRCSSFKKLKGTVDSKGYKNVNLYYKDKREKKRYRVHRLVGKHFIKQSPLKDQINHIDGDKLNNNKQNLEWCTCKENVIHAFETGLHTKRVGNNGSLNRKLSDSSIKEIRDLLLVGVKPKDLSVKFDVGVSTIYRVKNRESWRNIE